MARSILDIVIKLSKQGNADRETIKDLTKVKSAIANITMTAGALAGAFFTMKKVFDFGKEGAQIVFLQQRFSRLASTIGANTGLLDSLRESTRGLYSDQQLMASATDLMGLGLAKNSDELTRLMKVSSGLNMNMNQLVLTLTNMTTMRFDALGVSVDGFKEKVAQLKDAGMSADEAFKEAFLQQAEMQLEKVGEAADSNVASFLRAEAAWNNFVDALKVESLPTITRELENLLALMNLFSGDFETTNWRFFEDGDLLAFDVVEKGLNSDWAAAQKLAGGMEEVTTSVQDLTEATDEYALSLDTVKAAIDGPIKEAQQDYQRTMQDLQAELADLQAEEAKWTAPPKGSQKYDELQDKIAGVKQKIDETTAAYQEQARQIMFNIAQEQILASSLSASEQAQAVAVLGQSMGMWDQQTARAIELTSEWTTQLEAGAITADQYAVRLNQMGQATFDVETAAMQYTDTLVHLTGQTGRVTKQMDETPISAALAAESFDRVKTSVQTLTEQEQTAAEKAEAIRKGMLALDGMVANATVNIRVNGSLPNLGNYNSVRQSQDFGGFLAEGGPLSGDSVVVGEQGWEAMVKDRNGRWTVIPHEASKVLAGLGLLGDPRQLYTGGRVDRWWETSNPAASVGAGGIERDYGAPEVSTRIKLAREKASAPTSTTMTSSAVTAAADVVSQTVTPLAETTEQAVSSVAAAQAQTAQEARATRAQSAAQNDEVVGVLKGIDKRLARQEKTITEAFRTAMQQVMG